jgi:antibiotic biosynthesis monooxygenase (ABM) superfamily enzyme
MNFKFDKNKISKDDNRHKVSLIVISSVALTVTTIFSILNLLTANYSFFFIILITAITFLINLKYI